MLIGHFSDLHGDIVKLRNRNPYKRPDLWINTGDFLPNAGRMRSTGWRISKEKEMAHQQDWCTNQHQHIVERIAEYLDGIPMIWMPGNHDFFPFGQYLASLGYPVLDLETEPFVEFGGKRFAGFREIPFIDAEWMGEVHDFTALIDQTFSVNPDVLVTHAPPGGILDGFGGYGIKPLITALTYKQHKITHHLFGHEHSDGGKTKNEMGITFMNSATKLQFIEIP